MTEKPIILFNVSGDRKIEAKYALKDISFFRLDLSNPRFNHLNLVTEKEEEERIWEDKDTKILFDSIIASKGISEPIVVKEDGTVMEGNRRIVCLRKIKEKYSSNSDAFPKTGYEEIPTYIFPENIDPIEQSIYLARLHVSGKKEWDAFNQAKYVHLLKDKFELTFDKTSALIGMSKGKVIQKYWAFVEMQKFLNSYKKETINKYSFFEEAYKKKNVKEFVESGSNRKEFYDWILNNKLKGAKDIRQLSKLMGNNKLFSLFKEKGITEAYHRYQSLYELNEEKEDKIISDATNVLRSISREELKEMPKNKVRLAKYKALKDEIESFFKQIK